MFATYSGDRQYSSTECEVTRFGVDFPPHQTQQLFHEGLRMEKRREKGSDVERVV
jgi:hypothetical protein